MSILEKFRLFFMRIFKIPDESEEDLLLLADNEDSKDENNESFEEEEKIDAAKRTLITKLYVLKQEIEFFKNDFPAEYSSFSEKIQTIEDDYNSSLEESNKPLTYEANPEYSSSKAEEVNNLDREIKKFINNEVKFHILSKRLQTLAVKLNILYNVSIFHQKEKRKVLSQIENAIKVELEMVRDFKDSDAILRDKQLKDRIITLISYIDYEIFKTNIRNSDISPEELVERLVSMVEFDGFDFASTFTAFVKDELSDMIDLIYLSNENEYCDIYKKKIEKLLKEITYSSDTKNQLLEKSFWNCVLELESSILQMLKFNGVEKDKIKVKILDRLNINVLESEVLTLPKTSAYFTLTSLFSSTQDNRIFVLIKLFKNLSDDVTYKDIYFLLVLFEVISIVKNTPNELNRHVEKYLVKYPYDSRTLEEKKRRVIDSLSEKNYVYVFDLDKDDTVVISTLKKLNIDFEIADDNSVYINSFYFNGLGNVTENSTNI